MGEVSSVKVELQNLLKQLIKETQKRDSVCISFQNYNKKCEISCCNMKVEMRPTLRLKRILLKPQILKHVFVCLNLVVFNLVLFAFYQCVLYCAHNLSPHDTNLKYKFYMYH